MVPQDEESILMVSRFSGIFLLIMYIQLLVFQVKQELREIQIKRRKIRSSKLFFNGLCISTKAVLNLLLTLKIELVATEALIVNDSLYLTSSLMKLVGGSQFKKIQKM